MRPLFAPRERAASNLQKPAALQHFFLAAFSESPYRIGRRPGYQGPRCLPSSSVDSGKSARKKRRQLLTIAQWNVRTLLDRETADRPETRTALVAMELVKYNIDIAALCETRFSESGSLNDLEYVFSSEVANPKEKEGRPEWTLLSKRISSPS